MVNIKNSTQKSWSLILSIALTEHWLAGHETNCTTIVHMLKDASVSAIVYQVILSEMGCCNIITTAWWWYIYTNTCIATYIVWRPLWSCILITVSKSLFSLFLLSLIAGILPLLEKLMSLLSFSNQSMILFDGLMSHLCLASSLLVCDKPDCDWFPIRFFHVTFIYVLVKTCIIWYLNLVRNEVF